MCFVIRVGAPPVVTLAGKRCVRRCLCARVGVSVAGVARRVCVTDGCEVFEAFITIFVLCCFFWGDAPKSQQCGFPGQCCASLPRPWGHTKFSSSSKPFWPDCSGQPKSIVSKIYVSLPCYLEEQVIIPLKKKIIITLLHESRNKTFE